jgi:hypothetical protein
LLDELGQPSSRKYAHIRIPVRGGNRDNMVKKVIPNETKPSYIRCHNLKRFSQGEEMLSRRVFQRGR